MKHLFATQKLFFKWKFIKFYTVLSAQDDFRWMFEQWVQKRKLPKNTYKTGIFWMH